MKKFRVLEKLSTADVAFEVYGKTLVELFENAAEALFSVMADLSKVAPLKERYFTLEGRRVEELLFDFLSELIFLKDVEGMVFSKFKVEIKSLSVTRYSLSAEIWGEGINPETQQLKVDVKGVTMHQFEIKEMEEGFRARMVFDV